MSTRLRFKETIPGELVSTQTFRGETEEYLGHIKGTNYEVTIVGSGQVVAEGQGSSFLMAKKNLKKSLQMLGVAFSGEKRKGRSAGEALA